MSPCKNHLLFPDVPEVEAAKPGWKTSEFWIACGANLLGFLVVIGVISFQDKTTLEGALSSIVTAAVSLVSSVTVVVKYIAARTSIKSQTIQAEQVRLQMRLGMQAAASSGPPGLPVTLP